MKVTTIGKPSIRGPDGTVRPVPGLQSWALLGRLLLAERPVGRRTIAGELFCDAEDPLGALRWCLASLRRALGPDTLVGDPVELNLPKGTEVDIWILDTRAAADIEPAEFLEGVNASTSHEFSTWLLVSREKISTQLFNCYRRFAIDALSVGDSEVAINLAERAVRLRPLEESGHVLLVRALALAGKMNAANAHIKATEREFEAQLGEKPSPALQAAARRRVSDPPSGISQNAVVDALIKSGTAAVAAGAADAGLDNLRHAAALAERIGDAHLAARSFHELGTALVHGIRGYDDEGAIMLRRAAVIAAEAGYPEIAALSFRELGYLDALAGRRPSSAGYLREAQSYAENNDDILASIHAVSGFNLVDWGYVDDGLSHFEMALGKALNGTNKRRQIWALGLGGWGQLRAGNAAAAKAWLERCASLCDETGWVAFLPWPMALLAEAELQSGNRANSGRHSVEESLALSRQLGDPCWEAANGRALALLYLDAGDTAAAEQWLSHARTACCSVTDIYAGLLVQIMTDQMRLQQRLGNPRQVEALARELLAFSARTHADAHLEVAMVAINSHA